jgi:hypothetical protein
MKMLRLLVCLPLFFGAVANACTLCQSPTGTQVRKQIFADDFARNAIGTASPFLILAPAIAWLHFGRRKNRGVEQ